MKEEKIVKFKGAIDRIVYQSDNFKVYGVRVDVKKYPYIKLNQYRNVSIAGDMPMLITDVEYEFEAIEDSSKGTGSYKMVGVKRDKPLASSEVQSFLENILTKQQAKEIIDNYPDILERVKSNNLGDIDLSKLHGIGPVTFQAIVSKITDNFYIADMCSKFKNSISLSMMKKIYNKYKSADLIEEKLKAKPYATLTKISGIGFKKADSIIINMQKNGVIEFDYDIQTSLDRCKSCVIYLLSENEKNGNTKMNLAALRKQCAEMVPKCSDKFSQAIADDDIYYDKETVSVSLSATHTMELYIAKTIISHLNDECKWKCDIDKYRNINGFELSDEQIGVVKNVCDNRVSILNGPAGAGKTCSTQAIISMLDDLDKSYALFAPTGKAAKILADFTKRRTSTIHRGIGYTSAKKCVYNENWKLPFDIVIVDEMSMVDVKLFFKLMKAIDFSRTKLLMIGDNAQLPSVGCGNVFHDFIKSNLIPMITLTKIFRYDDGGLMRVATDIRTGKKYLDSSMKDSVTIFGNNKDYAFIDVSSITSSQSIINKVVSIYKQLVEKGEHIEDIQVLTAKNVGNYGTIILNNILQKIANPNSTNDNNPHMKFGDVKYYQGDLVMQCQNNYKAPMSYDYLTDYEKRNYNVHCPPTAFVANGESGIIESVDTCSIDVRFGDIVVRYNKDCVSQISLAYAITCHKSQGASIKNVILLTPQSDIFMLNSNLMYVGITRTKERCYHISAIKTVNSIIRKKENMNRATFLQQMLKDCVKDMKN